MAVELMETAPAISSNMDDDKLRRRRRITTIICFSGLILIAGIVAVIVYFTTRPENLEVTQSEAEESLPSLIKAAKIGDDGGALLIEYTEFLEDKSTLFYYATLQDFDLIAAKEMFDTDSNLSLYLTRTSEPTLEDLMSSTNINDEGSVILIGQLDSVTFPYRLPESFLPGDFNGLLLISEEEEDATTAGNSKNIRLEVLVGTSFTIVDPEQNIATYTDSQEETQDEAQEAPVQISAPLPPNLFSSLESPRYNVDGTITIDYVTSFQDGNVVTVPRLRFDIPEVVRAPGPFLYISKRPYSETSKGGDLDDENDIAIPIDEVNGGAFTVEGTFDQILDEIDDVQDLNEFVNGSWIVWCRPFGVWIGGGPISIA